MAPLGEDDKVPHSFKDSVKGVVRALVPPSVRRRLLHYRQELPAVGAVRFGHLRRTDPISRYYGYDRGKPIDRYYIEKFLRQESACITGRVLEIGERTYTQTFGQNVVQSDMLHVHDGVEGATYIDDLTDGSTLPSNAYDCVILTQTLHLIYDMPRALRTIYRVLKPGGALLATVPGITQVADETWNDSWYWSLTTNSAKRVAAEVFPPSLVTVEAHGNVLAATAFLHGLATEELSLAELDRFDREYPVTVTLKAMTAHEGVRLPMADRWNYSGVDQFAYDEETSYRKGIAFLDGEGAIEDWGCGTAFAKRFVARSAYTGIDGSGSRFSDRVADLQDYRSATPCLFMRHVLEHNWGWRAILRNALASFRRRMVLVIFTPFADSETKLNEENGIVDLAFSKEELLSFFTGLIVREETFASQTQYGQETIFYLERSSAPE